MWEAPTRMDNIRMTSNKVCDDSQRRRGDAAIQNDQQKSGKLLTLVITACWANSVLSFDFRYENDIWPWMFEPCRWMAYSHFSLDLFIIRRTPRHAESHHLLFVWSYPYINHFHYGNNIKQFSKWKSYCCCWMRNKTTLNSTDVFTGFYPPPNSTLPTVYYCDGSWRNQHTFLIAYLIYI